MTTLIFDCDGVLADTERHGHLPAFNQKLLEALGEGNKERLQRKAELKS